MAKLNPMWVKAPFCSIRKRKKASCYCRCGCLGYKECDKKKLKRLKGDARRWRWLSYSYVRISFHYPGPYTNFPSNDPATASAFNHETEIEKTLTDGGFDWRHEYSWSDGSCYKWVRTLDVNELMMKLNDVFKDKEESIGEYDIQSGMYFTHTKTMLGERFEREW